MCRSIWTSALPRSVASGVVATHLPSQTADGMLVLLLSEAEGLDVESVVVERRVGGRESRLLLVCGRAHRSCRGLSSSCVGKSLVSRSGGDLYSARQKFINRAASFAGCSGVSRNRDRDGALALAARTASEKGAGHVRLHAIARVAPCSQREIPENLRRCRRIERAPGAPAARRRADKVSARGPR